MPPVATLLTNLLRGLLMGGADVVPGVSGGTVALIVGIYERLIRSVRSGASALFRLLRLDLGEHAQLAVSRPDVMGLVGDEIFGFQCDTSSSGE
jgi:uncharacterized membrane protein